MALPNPFDILQAVIEATPDAIFVKDLDGRYVIINEAAARFVGKTPADIIGKGDYELYPEETARAFVEADRLVLETGQSRAFEGVATSAMGTQAYLVTKGVYRGADGRVNGLFGISHDITELRHANEALAETREALFRSQKMEAVGQLTGGIAHDFNNILAIIIGNVELLTRRSSGDAESKELLDALMRAALHGQELTSQLLAFSRRRALDPQPVDVNALIANLVRLAARTLGEKIQIMTATSGGSLIALVDPSALEAAVLNVALNARDAMPDGGTLTIRAGRADVTAETASDDELQPGTYVALEIEDTGAGMPSDVAARAFEPFFTTKPAGPGTGLGLSMVYGFAKQSGGSAAIASEPGRGTTIRILIPSAAEKSPALVLDDTPTKSRNAPRVVLLVEDEAAVRDTIRRQLGLLGHSVITAAGAEEAIGLLASPAGRKADLLLTDVVLRDGADGIALAGESRQLRPEMPVLLMSGFTAVPGAMDRIRASGAPLLSKPFTSAQLEAAIQIVCAG